MRANFHGDDGAFLKVLKIEEHGSGELAGDGGGCGLDLGGNAREARSLPRGGICFPRSFARTNDLGSALGRNEFWQRLENMSVGEDDGGRCVDQAAQHEEEEYFEAPRQNDLRKMSGGGRGRGLYFTCCVIENLGQGNLLGGGGRRLKKTTKEEEKIYIRIKQAFAAHWVFEIL